MTKAHPKPTTMIFFLTSSSSITPISEQAPMKESPITMKVKVVLLIVFPKKLPSLLAQTAFKHIMQYHGNISGLYNPALSDKNQTTKICAGTCQAKKFAFHLSR